MILIFITLILTILTLSFIFTRQYANKWFYIALVVVVTLIGSIWYKMEQDRGYAKLGLSGIMEFQVFWVDLQSNSVFLLVKQDDNHHLRLIEIKNLTPKQQAEMMKVQKGAKNGKPIKGKLKKQGPSDNKPSGIDNIIVDDIEFTEMNIPDSLPPKEE